MMMPTFEAPKGFTPDDETQEGDTFRFLGEAYMTDDGKICLTSMDGAKFMDKDEPEAKEEPPAEEATEPKEGEQTFDQKFQKLYDKTGGKFQ